MEPIDKPLTMPERQIQIGEAQIIRLNIQIEELRKQGLTMAAADRQKTLRIVQERLAQARDWLRVRSKKVVDAGAAKMTEL